MWNESNIDIDFKQIIQKYWETFLPEAADANMQQKTRAEILQWFSGEGTISQYRNRFGVNTMVSRANARLMLQSLVGFVKLSGYRGLVILFDEVEKSFAIMTKKALRNVHNNLMSLIESISSLHGLFLIYAATPDFFTDPKHGIIIYGSLYAKMGKPEECQPEALNRVWNFDELDTQLSDYQVAAKKIRAIYATAYPEDESELPSEAQVEAFVKKLRENQPKYGEMRFWRVMVTSLVAYFDDFLEDEIRPVQELHDDVMDRLREE